MAHAWWRDVDHELFNRITRERDEARAAILEPGGWEAMYKGQRDRADKAERERDEARAEIAEAKTSCMTFGGVLIPNECSLLDNIKMLKGDIDTLQGERDEARALLRECRDEFTRLGRGFPDLLSRLDALLGGAK